MAVFTNFATLTYNGGATNSNTTVGELQEALTVTKNAVSPRYRPGETVTYTISLVNSGTTPITVPTVTDDLGGYPYAGNTVYPLTYNEGSLRYYADGALQATPAFTAGPPLTVENVTVPAGGNAMLVYEATVNEFAPPGAASAVNNTVTVNAPGTAARLTAAAPVPIEEQPNLTITKTLNPAVVTANGRITYTFVIENSGNTEAPAGDNIVLADTFNPVLNNIAVTYNGAPWTETANYTYDQTTGQFATVPGQITVPAATYTQNTDGTYTVTPGITTVAVTGTV